MRQQGERPVGRHEDAWWQKLYDDSTGDTGPAQAADSIDDRFASAAGALGAEPEETEEKDRSGEAGETDRGETPVNLFEPAEWQIPRQVPRQDWWRESPQDPREDASEELPVQDRPVEDEPVEERLVEDEPVQERLVEDEPVQDGLSQDEPFQGDVPRADEWSPSSEDGTGPVFPPGRAYVPEDPQVPAPPDASPAAAASTPSAASAPSANSTPSDDSPASAPSTPAVEAEGEGRPRSRPRHVPAHVGCAPPVYDPEPTALPPAEADALDAVVPDTALEGARYGAWTLRAASVRGDAARYRGEPRRDALLTARFGAGDRALILVAAATGARTSPYGHRAASEACRWIGRAVARAHGRLTDDIRAARRGDLKAGLQRLTDRSLGKVRAGAAELGIAPEEHGVEMLRCLLLPADPRCRTRVFFGVGSGGLFRLRDGEWQDIEPRVTDTAGAPVVGYGSPSAGEGDPLARDPRASDPRARDALARDPLTLDLGITTPPSPYEPAPRPPHEPFRFRASIARPGDTLVLCGGGLAEPLREEPELSRVLRERWSGTRTEAGAGTGAEAEATAVAAPGAGAGTPAVAGSGAHDAVPGLAAFLADVQVRVKGYADDRTAAAVWEA